AAAGPTTAWACTTPCWSRTTTSGPRGACAGPSRRPGRPAPGCPWRSRWRAWTRSPRPWSWAATCCCSTTWSWRGWPRRWPPAAGGRAPGPGGAPALGGRGGRRGRHPVGSVAGHGPGLGELAVLLAVDVGNTEITIGVFEGQELAQHWRAGTPAARPPDGHPPPAGEGLSPEAVV